MVLFLQTRRIILALEQIEKLAKHLSSLPGVGERTAFRLAMHIFYSDDNRREEFAHSLAHLKDGVVYCKKCFNLSESSLCEICSNERRDFATVCVVENCLDLEAFERTGEYNGVYHVLHGLIAPLRGISVDDIKAKELIFRIQNEKIDEVILAFDSSMAGDTTANYLVRAFGQTDTKISRIAYGLSLGSDIENADSRSLGRALIGRTTCKL